MAFTDIAHPFVVLRNDQTTKIENAGKPAVRIHHEDMMRLGIRISIPNDLHRFSNHQGFTDLEHQWVHESARGLGIERQESIDDQSLANRQVPKDGVHHVVRCELQQIGRIIRGHLRQQTSGISRILLHQILEHRDRERGDHVREGVGGVFEFHLLEHVRGFGLIQRFQGVSRIRRVLSIDRGGEDGNVDGLLEQLGDPFVDRTRGGGNLDDRLRRQRPACDGSRPRAVGPFFGVVDQRRTPSTRGRKGDINADPMPGIIAGLRIIANSEPPWGKAPPQ